MKITFVTQGLSLAILLAISSLAPGQEPARKTPASKVEDRATLETVSYTHLTLPTICSV